MEFDPDTSAGYRINLLARQFARHLDAGIRPLGLALGAFPALVHLWQADGLTQRELVEKLGIEQPTMAATLARMERDGLITRQRDSADARVQRIRLTDKARSLREAALAQALAVNARALAPLDPAERATFLSLLRRVTDALEQAPDATRAPQR